MLVLRRVELAYRGRFAPSPTGAIHIGTARSALLSWLRARREGGRFVLRIDDLDAPRVRPGAYEQGLEDLRWLGLDWDEGPDVGGPHAPYRQSDRVQHYEAAVAKLASSAHLFRCRCSRRDLELASAPHGEDGVIYPGTCRRSPPPEGPHALRFKMPEPPPTIRDGVAGPSTAGLGRGDFVVKRRDGVYSYQLACAVDDIEMGITEVVRGDDLLGSAVRQAAIQVALGARPPAFVHVPLVLNPRGQRLAKRDGAISIAELRARGVRPERLVGWLAHSAGLRPTQREAKPHELVSAFTLSALPRTPIRVDPDALFDAWVRA